MLTDALLRTILIVVSYIFFEDLLYIPAIAEAFIIECKYAMKITYKNASFQK